MASDDLPGPKRRTDPGVAITEPQGADSAARSSEGVVKPPTLIGTFIGQYRISREIGKGGMGVVYEAVHHRIGQRAAVKVLAPQISGLPELVQRFYNEARAVIIAEHASLVKVFDYGQLPSGQIYMLMEYLEGQTLYQRLVRDGRLGEPEAVRLTRQIASAMAVVHSRGIYHRDLKPENIIVVPDVEAAGGERAKILDFGLAKITAHSGERGGPPSSNEVIGTPGYMAPEQCRGLKEATGAADVYSLGIIFYEMLAGRPPFIEPLPGDLMVKHMFEPPPPLSQFAPDVAVELEDLVGRMLAKLPADRPSMAELEAGLTHPSTPGLRQIINLSGRSQSTTEAVPIPRQRSWPLRWGLPVAGVVALLMAAAPPLISKLRRLRPAPPPVSPEAPSVMVRIPAGDFTLGSSDEEIAAAHYWCQQISPKPCPLNLFQREQPAHQVHLSAFWLDATEVTNAQFAGWLNRRPGSAIDPHHRMVSEDGLTLADLYPMYGSGGLILQEGRYAALPGYERRPVSQVTWDAAVAYCRDEGKRLPTEAEWEYAARGLTNRRFPWGFEAPRCDGVVVARGQGLGCLQLGAGAADVGTSNQDRSPEGVFDLAGNVSEWVQDSFRERYAACDEPCRDPLADAAADEHQAVRVIRGGDFAGVAALARATTRSRAQHDRTSGSVGFRCARSVAAVAPTKP